MKPRLTKAEARAYKARWRKVNEAEIEELRRTPIAVKVRQLGAMMEMARRLPPTEGDEREVAEVRERWNKLRKALANGLKSKRRRRRRK
jgi:hypothetical protein